MFEHVFVENPAFGELQRRWCALGHAPPQVVRFWEFGDPNEDRNRTAKPTSLFAGVGNVTTRLLRPDNAKPPRKGLLDTRRQWMDLWGKGTAEREFAREATPPGLAHAYVRDLLCP